MIRLRAAFYALSVFGLFLAARGAATAADVKPNVVFILADDQGWGDLSASGNTNLSTPHIDSLAKDGASFERFYVCPVCSPTRAEFFTGRYHPRGGVFGVTTGAERLNLDEKTLADTLKAAGYATGAFGKWHNGAQYPYHPNGRGFDEFYGFCSGHWATYFDAPLEHNGRIVQSKGYLEDDLTEHAIAFIEQHRAQPFFCYLAFNSPHSPMQVPDEFHKKFAGRKLEKLGDEPAKENVEFTRAALAMCENLDWNVGRLLAKLSELKLAERTIVIYATDNGPNSRRWNGGMRGTKATVDEGGVRSPFFVRWQGQIPAGKQVPQIAGAIDLLPTLVELTGAKRVGEKPLDGVSLKPLLFENSPQWPERMIFSHWNGNVSVRTDRYRLDANGRLYDMQADPGQKTDISPEKPKEAARLAAAVATWRKDVLKPLSKEPRPYTVGYAEFPITQLPARDAQMSGGIRRSSKHPNSAYFENWTAPADRITWDVAVETPGTYEAVLYYACPKADVGSTIELSLGESRLEAKVAEANEVPPYGAESDRTPRSESYAKRFQPLRLGTIELPKGRGTLTLRALKVPGRLVMEVEQLVLTLDTKAKK